MTIQPFWLGAGRNLFELLVPILISHCSPMPSPRTSRRCSLRLDKALGRFLDLVRFAARALK